MKHTFMKKVHRKLRSSKGASLSYAMMLLLVASVVGSILLNASTAASGRASQLAAADARYYSVNSAADLIMNEIENVKVSIVRQETKTWSTSVPITENYYNIVNIGTETTSETEYHYTSFFPGVVNSSVSRGNSMTMDWAIDKIMGKACENFEGFDTAVWNRSRLTGEVCQYSYTLQHTVTEGKTTASLDVQMDVKMLENGNLHIVLYNKEGSEHYRVQLTYSAEVSEANVVNETVGKTITPETITAKEQNAGIISKVKENQNHVVITEKTSSVRWNLVDGKEVSYEE